MQCSQKKLYQLLEDRDHFAENVFSVSSYVCVYLFKSLNTKLIGDLIK